MSETYDRRKHVQQTVSPPTSVRGDMFLRRLEEIANLLDEAKKAAVSDVTTDFVGAGLIFSLMFGPAGAGIAYGLLETNAPSINLKIFLGGLIGTAISFLLSGFMATRHRQAKVKAAEEKLTEAVKNLTDRSAADVHAIGGPRRLRDPEGLADLICALKAGLCPAASTVKAPATATASHTPTE